MTVDSKTCAWCERPWPIEKCGDEDGYGPRPACGPFQDDYLAKFLDRLSAWREADHEDSLVLTRNDVCQLLDWFKASKIRPGVTVERLAEAAIAAAPDHL